MPERGVSFEAERGKKHYDSVVEGRCTCPFPTVLKEDGRDEGGTRTDLPAEVADEVLVDVEALLGANEGPPGPAPSQENGGPAVGHSAEEGGGEKEIYFGDETLVEISQGTWGLRALLGFADEDQNVPGSEAGCEKEDGKDSGDDGLRLTGIRLTI